MKNSIKRLLCIILTLVMVFGISACGNSGETANPTKNPTKGDSNDNGGTNSALKIKYFTPESKGENGKDYSNYDPYANAKKFEGKTVKFATWIDHQSTEGAKPINDFMKKYGINVELVFCSQAGYIEELLALISAGNSPDIFVENTTFPMTLQIAQEISATGLDLNEPIWDWQKINACSVGDKIYAIDTVNSIWSGLYCVIYNRELMESNGIKTPAEYYAEGNWTWETMEECMKQVSALGDDYYGGSIPDMFNLLTSVGTDIVKYDHTSGKFSNTLSNPQTIKVMQYVANLSKQNLLTNQETFSLGRVGLIVKDPYGLKKIGYFRAMDGLDLGVTYIPAPDASTPIKYGTGTRAYGIVKGAKNPEAAGLFLRYFLDPANYALEDSFISVDAGNWYFESLEKAYKDRETNPINYSYSQIGNMIGKSSWGWASIGTADASQAATVLASRNNVCDQAVQKANELTAKMK